MVKPGRAVMRWPTASVVAFALLAAACSGQSAEEELEAALAEADTDSTTTSTEPPAEDSTTTSLSEEAQAAAEIEEVITAWYTAPFDTSRGEEGLRLEYLTGLLQRRVRELGETTTAEGHVLVSGDTERIEILSTEVDLDEDRGQAEVCTVSSAKRLDASTGEQIGLADDPSYATKSVVQVELTADGWKLSEFFPSQATENPQVCELSAS